jgi:DNA-binding Lrp family transcriptional regulator
MGSNRDRTEAQHFIKNLSGDSKFIISKNSRVIGLSRQTYQNKLDGLRDQKIITNFTININPNIQPNNLKYIMVEIKTNPKEPQLANELLKIPHLKMLDGIFGDFSLFALFIFKSPEEYYEILNTIDTIMAKSYFKKYQIIDTIKIFKTNGIGLRELNAIANIELEDSKKINLNQIAQKLSDVKYNPEKFPGLVMKTKKINATVIIDSKGKTILTGLREVSDAPRVLDEVKEKIAAVGINIAKAIIVSQEIDNIDEIILNILRESQGFKPISTYEIKNIIQELYHLEISQSTIHNRIKRLEKSNIILNYTVNFCPRMVGFNGKYLLRIKPKDPSKYNELALKLESNKNITDLFRIGEQYGLFAIIRVKKIEDYSKLIKVLYDTEEIEDTYTNFVLDELKPYTNFTLF